MKTLIAATLSIALGTFLIPSESFAQSRSQNVVDYVVQSGGEFDRNPFDYDILVTAVLTANAELDGALVAALTNPDARLTLFAPNDLAFIRTARDLGYRGWSEQGAWEFLVEALTGIGGGDPIPVLTSILQYHVAPRQISSFGLLKLTLKRGKIPTLLADGNGRPVTIRPNFLTLIDKDPDIPNPRVTLPFDVRTGNGRVHTINRVLIPTDL